jgi:hypothetical protein
MRGALAKMLPADHRSVEKRSCKPRDNNEQPKYQNAQSSFWSTAFPVPFVLAEGRVAPCCSGWAVLSFVGPFHLSFYGTGETKFPRTLCTFTSLRDCHMAGRRQPDFGNLRHPSRPLDYLMQQLCFWRANSSATGSVPHHVDLAARARRERRIPRTRRDRGSRWQM